MEWANALLSVCGDNAKIINKNSEYVKIEILKDVDNNIYPFKVQDSATSVGFDLLRKRGLIADDSDDDINFTEMFSGIDL